MPINEVQDAFVQEAARPHMERIVRYLHGLDTFVLDYDAIQSGPDALPEDSTVLDDGRTDAPILTGANVRALRDFSSNMSAIVTPNAKQILISLMVRDLNTVLGLN